MWVLSDFMNWQRNFCAQACGFKRIYGLAAQLLCTGMLVLSDFKAWEFSFCVQACGFQVILSIWRSTSVHRHVGFKRFYGLTAQPLWAGMWVLSEFMGWEQHFCAQACGF
jgi:hypothetical protein